MQAEDFFPLGWLDRQFRRQPYPDMTYREALFTAGNVFWNIGSVEALGLANDLAAITDSLAQENPDFPGRSEQMVTELNELWRGKVLTLLTWFKTRPEASRDGGLGGLLSEEGSSPSPGLLKSEGTK